MKRFLSIAVFLLFLIQQLFAQTKPISALVIKDEQSKIMTPIDLEYSNSSESKKSVVLAVVASLILPGMGELYAGSFESGK